jgi:hypothetical protein
MLVGGGLLFNQQLIPTGSGTTHSTPGNISGKKQVTFKLSSTLACTAKVYYCDGDPTNSSTVWYPSPTAALNSISLGVNTPVTFVDEINAGWTRIDIPQQGAVTPVVTASFETKAQN